MFDQIMGIPAHPLLVHAAVVFVPLLALGSVLYAVFPPLRSRLNWAVALVAVAAAGSAVVARFSGDAFRDRLRGEGAPPELLAKVASHKQFGDYTMWSVLALAVVTLLLVWATPARRRPVVDYDNDDGGRRRGGGAAVLQVVLALVIVGLAAASVYYVVRTGDSGARMVWGSS